MGENDRPTTLRYWLALTLLAAAIRVVVACCIFSSLPDASDPSIYAEFARKMVAGENNGRVYEWTPGRSYALAPFFLAFGSSRTVVQANSIFFDVGCVLAAAAVAHRVLRRRSAARLTGWVAAFYPPAIVLSGLSYTMNVTMFAMLWGVYFALRASTPTRSVSEGSSTPTRSVSEGSTQHPRLRFGLVFLSLWFLSGAFFGFAILTRPSSASIVIAGIAVLTGWLIARWIKPALANRVWRHVSSAAAISAVAAFLLGAACCLAPVLKRQHDLGAGWCIAANNELIFFNGNNPYTPLYKTWHLGSKKASPEFDAYVVKLTSQGDARSAMLAETRRYILTRPDLFLLRTVNRIRSFWGFDYLASANIKESRWGGRAAMLVCLAAEAGGYCLTMLLVLAGLFGWRRGIGGGHALLLVALALAYQFPYVLTYACGSYRVPVMGFLFPFAGLALDEIRCRGKEFCRTIKNLRWFWISAAVFVAIQIEYAYFILASHGGLPG